MNYSISPVTDCVWTGYLKCEFLHDVLLNIVVPFAKKWHWSTTDN